jgi:hypothetical protein
MVACVAPSHRPSSFLVAIAYDIEPVHRRSLGTGEPVEDILRAEWTELAATGIQHVVVGQVDDQWRDGILDLAADRSLRVALPDRDIAHYVQTGGLPPGVAAADLPGRVAEGVRVHPASWGIAIVARADDDCIRRAERVVADCRAQGLNTCLVVPLERAPRAGFRGEPASDAPDAPATRRDSAGMSPRITPGTPRLGMITWPTGASTASGLPAEALLRELHEALIAGDPGGLVIGPFRAPPGGRYGLLPWDEPLQPATVSAIERFRLRAGHYGSLLAGWGCDELRPADGAGALRTVLFHSATRAAVLVLNSSGEGYLRREVTLPAELAGRTWERAVEVPAWPGARPGDVHRARDGTFRLPVTLRPGDAVLFEVFQGTLTAQNRDREGAAAGSEPRT